MPKVRVPVFGTVGRSVTLNTDANIGAQLGVDLFDEYGNILDIVTLAQQVQLQIERNERTNEIIYETQIIDGPLLARVADNETITGFWTFDQYLDLTPQTAPTYSEGRLWYDSDFGGLSVYNDEAEIVTHLGEDLIVFVRNATGVTITKGSPVYSDGATGNRPNIKLAQANALATSRVMGVAMHDIESNSDGYVLKQGKLINIDTSAFTAGDELFLSSTVAGGIQNTKPTGTDFAVVIGECLISNPTNGEILVHLRPLADTASKSVDQVISGSWDFTADVELKGGADLYIYDAGDTDYARFHHDGDDLNFTFTNTTDWNVLGPTVIKFKQSGGADVFTINHSTTAVDVLAGYTFRIRDAGNTDNAAFSHDGTDFTTAFTNTTDWNITGITAIQAGTVDADFDALTATSYGGIAEPNLLDKTASENITGSYNFSNVTYFTKTASGGGIVIQPDTTVDRWGLRLESSNNPANDSGFWSTSDSWRLLLRDGLGNLNIDLNPGGISIFEGAVDVKGTLQIDDGAGNALELSHTGTNVNVAVVGTTNYLQMLDGLGLRIFDSTDTDYAQFEHDGIDFNTAFTNTADWNISGITAIQAGTVDADFDALTATSYGGITEANLLDKTANESVTGGWDFDGFTQFDGNTQFNGAVLGTHVTDLNGIAPNTSGYNKFWRSSFQPANRPTGANYWTGWEYRHPLTSDYTTQVAYGSSAADPILAVRQKVSGVYQPWSYALFDNINHTITGTWTFTDDLYLARTSSNSNLVFNVDTGYDADIQYRENNTLKALIRWDPATNILSFQDRDPSGVQTGAFNFDSGDFEISGYVNANNIEYSAWSSVSSDPGTDAWYTIFSISDTSDTPVHAQLLAYAHSSIEFIVTKGYQSAHSQITVLSVNTNSVNPNFKYVKGIRIVDDTDVQVKLNSGSIVDLRLMTTSNSTVAHQATPQLASGAEVVDCELDVSGLDAGAFFPDYIQLYDVDNTANYLTIDNTSSTARLRSGGSVGVVDLWDGLDLRIRDATNNDYAQFSHDGIDFNIDFTNTANWEIHGADLMRLRGINFAVANATFNTKFFVDLTGAQVQVRDGFGFRISNSADTDWALFSHDGTDFNTAFTNTADWNITGLSGAVKIAGGAVLYHDSETSGKVTISTSAPSGGSDGDIWLRTA